MTTERTFSFTSLSKDALRSVGDILLIIVIDEFSVSTYIRHDLSPAVLSLSSLPLLGDLTAA